MLFDAVLDDVERVDAPAKNKNCNRRARPAMDRAVMMFMQMMLLSVYFVIAIQDFSVSFCLEYSDGRG